VQRNEFIRIVAVERYAAAAEMPLGGRAEALEHGHESKDVS